MNLGYWGVKLPVTDTANDPARVLPITDVGEVAVSVVSGEILSPTDSLHKTLTIPAGSIKARIQVNGSAAWYTLTGTTPVIASNTGYKVADLTVIDVYGPTNLAAFKILAHTGGTPKVYVEYYKYERVIND